MLNKALIPLLVSKTSLGSLRHDNSVNKLISCGKNLHWMDLGISKICLWCWSSKLWMSPFAFGLVSLSPCFNSLSASLLEFWSKNSRTRREKFGQGEGEERESFFKSLSLVKACQTSFHLLMQSFSKKLCRFNEPRHSLSSLDKWCQSSGYHPFN